MPERHIAPWVRRFLLDYLPRHRGASSHTVASYALALKGLLDFLGRRGKRLAHPTFEDLTAENVLAFLAALETRRKNGPATRNARLAAIQSFLRYAFLMGCIGKVPYERLRHIAYKRKPARGILHLEATEIEAVFRAADHRTRDGFRDLAILKLLYNTGARASEIATIKVSGMALDDQHVTVFGKGGKSRLCGIWQTTAAMIRIYLASERRRPLRGCEDYLFINQRRRPFTRFGIRDLVQRYVAKAAKTCPSLVHKRVTPHTFRHTTGVHLLEAGVDLNTIREWLGHEHMSTTELYARASLGMRSRALAKLEQIDRRLFQEVAAVRDMPVADPGIRRWLESLQG